MESEKYVLTVVEAGRRLGLSRPLAYRAVNNGDIPAIRVGRRILVPVAALEKLLSEAGKPKPQPAKA